MDNITFAQKNNLIVKYQDGKSFYKDLELFKKHFQGHPLNTELAMANQFSEERLDGQMLHILLDEVDIKDILDNRAEKQPQAPKQQTEADILEVISSNFNISQETLATIEANYFGLLKNKSDQEIIAFVTPIVQLAKPAKTEVAAIPEAKSEQTATTETTESKTTDTNKKKGQKTKSSPK